MAGYPQGEGLTILIQGQEIDERRMKELMSFAPKAKIRAFAKAPELEAAVDDAVIVGGALSEPALARAKKLKWIHSWAAGPDKQLFPEMVASPVVLTCSKGNGAIPLAEHAVLLMNPKSSVRAGSRNCHTVTPTTRLGSTDATGTCGVTIL